ncbi:MAG: PEP-CTERM sorting domain-containing protein [Alphaproteobacteria bacterium]|nr:PEP-CTERM sorting domain-containing protein [Alphaproteobacteria bacterium]
MRDYPGPQKRLKRSANLSGINIACVLSTSPRLEAIVQTRYFASLATAAFVAVSVISTAGATTVTVDFEGVNVTTASGPVGGPLLDNYLAGFGISLANVVGNGVFVNSDVNDPDAPLTDQTSLASSGTNFLEEYGGQFVSYDLTFAQVLDSFSFTRTAYYGATGSGLVYPAWSAEAFDSLNNSLGVLANVGISGTFNDISNPVPAQTFSISAAGQIASVRIAGNHGGFAGRNTAAIDDLVLTYTEAPSVPEPATLALFGLSVAGMMRLRARRTA